MTMTSDITIDRTGRLMLVEARLMGYFKILEMVTFERGVI